MAEKKTTAERKEKYMKESGILGREQKCLAEKKTRQRRNVQGRAEKNAQQRRKVLGRGEKMLHRAAVYARGALYCVPPCVPP